MNHRRDHARGRRSGHSDKVAVAARSHSVNIESRETPSAAAQKKESDQPAELDEANASGKVGKCQRSHSPGVCEKGRRHSEADYIGERVEFFPELAVGAHGAGDASVKRIEKNRESNGARGLVKIRRAAFERR